MKKELEMKLSKYNLIKAEIQKCNSDIADLFETIDCERDVKAIVYDLPSISKTYQVSDPTYMKAQKIIDYYEKEIARIEEQIHSLFTEKKLIEEMLNLSGLENEEKKLIELLFFKKYKPDMVARSMNYSRRQVYNIKNKSLEKIEKYIHSTT